MQKQGHPCLENIEHESESGRVELVRVRRDGLLELCMNMCLGNGVVKPYGVQSSWEQSKGRRFTAYV